MTRPMTFPTAREIAAFRIRPVAPGDRWVRAGWIPVLLLRYRRETGSWARAWHFTHWAVWYEPIP